jgi:hypothetical protein
LLSKVDFPGRRQERVYPTGPDSADTQLNVIEEDQARRDLRGCRP